MATGFKPNGETSRHLQQSYKSYEYLSKKTLEHMKILPLMETQ
jgi:hypothetical protein